MVRLRPQIDADLPLLTGGISPYDDFGPRSPRHAPAPAELEGAGGLTVLDDAGQLTGDVGWHWRQWGPTAASRCPMIGIWLRPEFRSRGIGASAQAQLVELFFRHTNTHRVEAHTTVDNVAEQRSLESAGFTREGTGQVGRAIVSRLHGAGWTVLQVDRGTTPVPPQHAGLGFHRADRTDTATLVVRRSKGEVVQQAIPSGRRRQPVTLVGDHRSR